MTQVTSSIDLLFSAIYANTVENYWVFFTATSA